MSKALVVVMLKTNQKTSQKCKDDEDYDENRDRRGNAPDEQEMRELEEQRRQERAERLADEAERQRQRDADEENIDPDNSDEDYTDRRGHGENDELPTYTRTPYLIKIMTIPKTTETVLMSLTGRLIVVEY